MCIWGDVRTWVASCTHSCLWGSYVPGKLDLISKGGGKGAMQSSRIWNRSAKGPSGPCSSSLSSLLPGLGLWVPEGPEEYMASGSSCVPASLCSRGTSGQGRSCHMQQTAAGAPGLRCPAHGFLSDPGPPLGWCPPTTRAANGQWGPRRGSRAGQGGANSTCSLLTLLSSFKVTGRVPPFLCCFPANRGIQTSVILVVGNSERNLGKKAVECSQAPLGPHPRPG